MSTLVDKIRRSLERDSDLPLSERARKGVRYLFGTVLAPSYLADVTRRGARARTVGRPRIVNAGTITIGDDLALTSTFSPVEIVTQPGATITIGSGVHVNYGTSIRAASTITIGDRASIGPYCIIDDTDLLADAMLASPIRIGACTWLAGRVTLLPGTTIGENSVITAGSIVSGEIPANVVAGGVPARVLRSLAETAAPVAPAPSSRTAVAPLRDTYATPGLAPLRGMVLADFTVGDLAIRLADAADGPVMEVVDAPFCQTTQGLLSGAPAGAADFVLVWTRPELALPAFDRIVRGDGASEADLHDDVDAFATLVRRGATSYRMAFVPTWVQPAHQRGLGLIDARPGGVAWALAQANARLMSQLADVPNVFVLHAQRWHEASATRGRSMAKGWYLGKVPYSTDLFAEVALDLKAAARAIAGQARKLLVLDLDDTLWGGIVGDAGWENLQLGGHDGVGESFVDFQQAVKALTRRGIVLGIVSKNTESVALEAIDRHPQMVLRRSDFVGWRINWTDKAQNIADLAAELNLGLQSVVFIDDNPVERARVREALPEVFVPEWPEDKLLYTERLAALRCFDSPAISREDAERTALYAAERERGAAKASVGSIDEWLGSLGIAVHVEPLTAANLARTAQLLNKTNQMNLSTRRLSEAELVDWARGEARGLWAVTVSDKFGSAGLTGIVSVEADSAVCRVVDLVLSCRVMGRRIEHLMLHLAVEWARARGLSTLHVTLRPTAKNKPCHDLLLASDLGRDDSGLQFTWDCATPFAAPAGIAVEWIDAPASPAGAR
ncbi:MAG: HAD-IIIC family phosphatase [Gemmatimonadaceae bacterium]|nr:HAD-IIIC family phosphatase [Gemmatimonadaceae bacterium]